MMIATENLRRPVRHRHCSGFAFWLTAVTLLLGPGVAEAQSDVCRPRTFEGERFIVCSIDLRIHRVALFWRGPDKQPFGSLQSLNRHLQAAGQRPLFAMNAGMYHAELDPVGLYVENGRQITRISTTSGPGNFHMKPNGVFFVAGDKAGVMETGQFIKRAQKTDFATQSGPMLVVNNRLHPKFPAEGVSRKIRNGVGVRGEQQVYFALSEEPVTFTAFARLFREELGVSNALFLDGSVSSLTAPGVERTGFRSLGPLIAAFEKRGSTSR